jgi:hypothetical protein
MVVVVKMVVKMAKMMDGECYTLESAMEAVEMKMECGSVILQVKDGDTAQP